ncbi:AI-2E family transporter [Neisseria sp. Ec49-e6-T10]|uniref:AI-2E family transporter n=1 Tax=Neisseria sp. Ec49-e6-T10 TaxID=3140744 RepID=UPI003EB91EBA
MNNSIPSNTNHNMVYLNRISYLLAIITIIGILYFHLLSALFSGLLVYELTKLLATKTYLSRLGKPKAKLVAISLLTSFIISILVIMYFGIIAVFHHENSALPLVLDRLENITKTLSSVLPQWLAEQLPQTENGWKVGLIEWAKNHTTQIQLFGSKASRSVIHAFIGMVIGALIALSGFTHIPTQSPLPTVFIQRISKLSLAFRTVIFSQVKISAINTFFTWIYLSSVMFITDYQLPFAKTIIILTFFIGLLPIIGNIITNTLIVLISLTHSITLGITSLIFLVVIHKLEYFLNAQIIGAHIHARTWELLIAMLVMETIFGLPGVVSAPVFYAYLKEELRAAQLI